MQSFSHNFPSYSRLEARGPRLARLAGGGGRRSRCGVRLRSTVASDCGRHAYIARPLVAYMVNVIVPYSTG